MTTIIIVLGMLMAFVIGFYFGYLKREEEPPKLIQGLMQSIANIKDDIDDLRDTDKKEEPPTGFY